MRKYFLLICLFILGCESQYRTAGKVYIQQEEYDKAAEQFNLQLKQTPNDPDAWWWLGMAYTYQKKYEDACQCMDKVAEIAPEKQELKKQIPFLWSLYYSAGISAYQEKSWELAKNRFTQATRLEPDSFQTYMNLGLVYVCLEQEDTAIVYYKKVIELDTNNIDAYRNLGIYYMKKKEYDEAQKYFNKVLGLKPKDADILYRIGIAYYLKEDYPNAEASFKRAIECDSTLEDAYFNLGATLVKQNKYDESIEVLKKTIEIKPNDVEALLHLGGTYLLTKKYDAAIEIYTKIIQLDPAKREAYEGRANAYWKLGKKAEAEADLRIVKEMK
ncbi:MAG: tetratricopeptide repeat protein [Candidatus Stahlbacteria bacterium]|nr:tetratricopeptide repeat protein [Candidatus Stahlbacteria bacterium]